MMHDMENVIKGLEAHGCGKSLWVICGNCPYSNDGEVPKKVAFNIDDLLKEQEAVEPYSHLTDDSDLYFTCGKCWHVIWSESYKYCPMCGLKIAWNGERR